MPLWMLRARFSYLMGGDTFIASKCFSEETYDIVLHKMYFKMMDDHTNPESYEPSKQALALDHKTPTKFIHNRFEIDLWKVDVEDDLGDSQILK